MGIIPEDPREVSVVVPGIIEDRCSGCGACIPACRHNALFLPKGGIPMLIGECNGCEACFLVCPEAALERKSRPVGDTYCNTGSNPALYTGELSSGEEESAHVVKALKARVAEDADNYDLIVVDTAPGAHCNVLFALQGVDLAFTVTSQLLSGFMI